MTYIRAYGRRDLFITFTCNPKWDEVKNLLLPGQTSMHRHDVTARVFKQKFKSLINLMCTLSIWRNTLHILIWLVDKERLKENDNIISAESPDPNADQELFNHVTTNMILGPCITLNMMLPCMDHGQYTKRFPKPCTADTITNINGYPSYRCRDVYNVGQSYDMSNGRSRY